MLVSVFLQYVCTMCSMPNVCWDEFTERMDGWRITAAATTTNRSVRLTCNITHLCVCSIFQSLLQLRLQYHLLVLRDLCSFLGHKGLSWREKDGVDDLRDESREKKAKRRQSEMREKREFREADIDI